MCFFTPCSHPAGVDRSSYISYVPSYLAGRWCESVWVWGGRSSRGPTISRQDDTPHGTGGTGGAILDTSCQAARPFTVCDLGPQQLQRGNCTARFQRPELCAPCARPSLESSCLLGVSAMQQSFLRKHCQSSDALSCHKCALDGGIVKCFLAKVSLYGCGLWPC